LVVDAVDFTVKLGQIKLLPEPLPKWGSAEARRRFHILCQTRHADASLLCIALQSFDNGRFVLAWGGSAAGGDTEFRLLDTWTFSELGRVRLPQAECQVGKIQVLKLEDGSFLVASILPFEAQDNLRLYTIDAAFSSITRVQAPPVDDVESLSFITRRGKAAPSSMEDIRLVKFQWEDGKVEVLEIPSMRVLSAFSVPDLQVYGRGALEIPELVTSPETLKQVRDTVGDGFEHWVLPMGGVYEVRIAALDGTLLRTLSLPEVSGTVEFVLCSAF
jgi:hypothetical protein